MCLQMSGRYDRLDSSRQGVLILNLKGFQMSKCQFCNTTSTHSTLHIPALDVIWVRTCDDCCGGCLEFADGECGGGGN